MVRVESEAAVLKCDPSGCEVYVQPAYSNFFYNIIIIIGVYISGH